MSEHFRKMALVSEDELARLRADAVAKTESKVQNPVDAINELLQKKLNDESAHKKQDLRKKVMQDYNDAMHEILTNPGLDDRTKVQLYQQNLVKYNRIRGDSSTPASTLSNHTPSNSNQSGYPYGYVSGSIQPGSTQPFGSNTGLESFEEIEGLSKADILSTLPERHQRKALQVLTRMQAQGGLDWNSEGEVVIDGVSEPGSNIQRFTQAYFTNLPTIVSKVCTAPGWRRFRAAGDLAKSQLDMSAATPRRPLPARLTTSPMVQTGVHASERPHTRASERQPLVPTTLQYPEQTGDGPRKAWLRYSDHL